MGGPLATLAAIDLISIGINVKYLYTFGSFRVGDFKFAQWYKNYDTNMKSFRVTNGRDPIVHMP
jgi:predicted lipase